MKNLILIFLFPIMISAQEEMLVNSSTIDNQRAPIIAGLGADGSFAVVWTSENLVDSNSKKDIAIKFFENDFSNPGEEKIVNDFTVGEQEYPAIAMNSSGKTIVSWASYNPENPDDLYDIKAKIYEDRVETKSEFTVNSFSKHSQTVPSVDILESGEFIIVWESWFQDGSGRGIYGQIFDEVANKKGKEFLINTTVEFSQAKPKVKYLNNGNIIVVWESWNETQKGYDLFAKIFDNEGNPIIEEKRINNYTEDYQWFADVDINSKDEIAIAWCSWEQDGYDGGVYLQKYDANLNPILPEQLINNTTRFYQWLPKVKFLNDEDIAVLWSGWKTDGSREGIYYRTVRISNANDQYKFLNRESRVNDFTAGYQWEPDFIVMNDKIISVWSGWEEFGTDYDIVGKEFYYEPEIGTLKSDKVKHISGRTTSQVEVRILNSAEVTDHQYEISFEGDEELFMNVKDLDSDEIKVSKFPLNLGKDVFYATDEFDGIVLNIEPDFKLGLNEEKTNFVNRSNTNVGFEIKESSINQHLVPIDAVLLFGDTDTLANGNYKVPLDTAYDQSLNKNIVLPFIVQNHNYAPHYKFETIVFEKNKNNKWEPGERIFIRTPEEFRESDYETFLEINSTFPENLIMPGGGDNIYIYMNKPLTSEDLFQFQVDSSSIILELEEENIINKYKLYQNYPNPFNPSTTIDYSITNPSKIRLNIYDILGQKVETLIDEFKLAGKYSIEWNPGNISSGVYFYVLETSGADLPNNFFIKKMLYIK